MLVVIQQPPFMCKLVEFVRMINADTVVLMENSQYVKQSTHNRIVMPTVKNGYVTAPVRNTLGTMIKDVEVVSLTYWFSKFKKQILQSYARVENYDELVYFVSLLEEHVTRKNDEDSLADFNIFSVLAMVKAFGVEDAVGNSPTYVRDTGLVVDRPNDASEYVGKLLDRTGATHYVSGKKSMDAYLDVTKLPPVYIHYQDYRLPMFAREICPDPTVSALEFLARVPKALYTELLRDNTHEYRKRNV